MATEVEAPPAAPAELGAEEVPEAATPAPAANGAAPETDHDPEARYRYDEALLIKGKGGKVRRPTKPDESERNLAIDKLKAEVEKHSARIKEIKEIAEAARSARMAGQSGNQEILNRLKAHRNEFQTVLRQKQHIREELNQVIKTKDDLRAESRKLRQEFPRGANPDNLERQIADMEHQMQHETVDNEKQTFQRIQQLKAARPQFQRYAAIDEELNKCEERRKEIQKRLDECQAVLTAVKQREEADRAVLEQSRNKQVENEPDIPALNVEKKECWDIIQAIRATMDKVRKEFNDKYQEYIKLDRNYNNYMRSVKRQEYLERQKARAEREAAENGAEGEGGAAAPSADAPASEAYAAEVFTLDQLLTYLRKLAPADDKSVAQQEKKDVEVPKGMKLLKKNDDDVFMAVTKKPKNQGKKGSAAAAPEPAAPAKPAEPAKKKLNHGLDTLKTFMQFGIEVPQTTAELPATITKVEAKKEYYLELRRTGKKHEEPKPAPKAAPAAAEPAAEEADTAASSSAPAAAEESAAATANQADSTTEEAAGSTGAVVVVQPAATEKAAHAKQVAASVDGVGVDLAVDETSGAIAVKLRLSE